VLLLPRHLAEAIEWVLRPKGAAPDLSRLTSEQLQLLPLHVAQAFMDLTLAVQQQPTRRSGSGSPSAPSTREFWLDARARQRARRARQRTDAIAAAHQRLYAWYMQTGSALQRGFAS
jgi:hypothetical protein